MNGLRGSGGQSSRLQEAEVIFGSLAETSFFSRSVSRADKKPMSRRRKYNALEKRTEVLHIVLTATRVLRICVLLDLNMSLSH